MKKKHYIFLLILSILPISYFFLDEPIPKGIKNIEAEQYADNMLKAINYSKWEETDIVKWEFPRGHSHVWDKERNFSLVKWDNYEVLYQIDSLKGIVYKDGKRLLGEEAKALIEKAWKFWANDSFWLNAPAKIRDGGTERKLVLLEDGNKALLVKYYSGGATPGDAYLWVCDENYLPKYCKMWVSIIPIGGVKFNWEDWITLNTGAKLAQNHYGLIDVNLKNIEGADKVKTLYPDGDPFKELEEMLN